MRVRRLSHAEGLIAISLDLLRWSDIAPLAARDNHGRNTPACEPAQDDENGALYLLNSPAYASGPLNCTIYRGKAMSTDSGLTIGAGTIIGYGAVGSSNRWLWAPGDISLNNIALGIGAGNVATGPTTGHDNTFIGASSGISATTGIWNVGIGTRTLEDLTTGSGNIAIGTDALPVVSTGNDNIAIGLDTLNNVTSGAENTCVGRNSMSQVSATSTANCAFGYAALGSGATLANFNYNTAVGWNALYYGQGQGMSALGAQALSDLATFQFATALVAGQQYAIYSVGTTDFTTVGAPNNNVGTIFTATGAATGAGVVTGANTNYNTAIGYNTGRGIITGHNNTIIGAQVTGLPSTLSNAIILATGDGRILLDYNSTVSGAWNAAAPTILPTYIVAAGANQIPAATPGLKGGRAFVSDSNVTLASGLGNIVATGGANFVPVYCDGTNWRIG